MSHEAVQAILQRTLSDETFRSRLFVEPDETLREYSLTSDEAEALRSLYVETEPGDNAELDQRQSKRPFWLTH